VEAPILIAPNWETEFHIHVDASNLAVGAMLAQNLDDKCDQLITYVLWLLSSIEKNETITKQKTLHKFCHYLPTNQFVFYVDHMALITLFYKP
jgi:hypothetical protein